MKDFPVFTTQHGVASLILKEIPYRKECYIHLQSTEDPEQLLRECVSFCKACGAEKIQATGHPILERFSLHMTLIQMRGMIEICEEEIPSMFPVTERTVPQWRELYNRRMNAVDHASTLEKRDEPRIIASGGAYFVHESGIPIGIGWLEDDRLSALAALIPGAGEKVCKAMQSLIPNQQMTLEVASTNVKAIRLYERLGFLKTAELARWYQVF